MTDEKRLMSRRGALLAGAGTVGVALAGRSVLFAKESGPQAVEAATAPGAARAVVTPNLATLPHRLVDGVKVFHLVAEEIEHEFAPGIIAKCWGYNGSTPGPTIEAVEGDRVRIYVTNRLPAATTVHWHGLILPSGMDGIGGLSHKPIDPGETYRYEFDLKQHGTHMYHSHHDEMTQMALGLVGSFVIHPKSVTEPVERDYVLLLGEWSVPAGTSRPDPNEMTDFNLLTINGRVFPGTQNLVAKKGDRVRVRIGNLSAMDHHPIHLHGYTFTITQTDGGVIPMAARWPEVTVLVPTGATRTIEFVAEHPGDWALHCHMTHHVMNQMGHNLANMTGMNPDGLDKQVRSVLPGYMTMGQNGMGDMGAMGMKVPENSIPMAGGRGPHGYITMGGMFTIVKVRETLPDGEADPGWYDAPAGSVATVATADELRRDGIDAPTRPATPADAPDHSGHENHSGHSDHGAPAGGAAPATTRGVVYACPMHPQVTSNEPGNCPECGMKLLPHE